MNEFEWQLLEDKQEAESVTVGGVELKKGDPVRLLPRQGGDIFDLALAGQIALIESIEEDYEGRRHVAVVLEDDPGKDLGMLRQPGHRFFFAPDEVEPVIRPPKVLVAGVGNIFLGDDAFGVEVVRRLSVAKWPDTVRVTDFGIRGYDLAYALLDPHELTILVDASPRGGAPGTLYVIEPDLGGDPQAGQAVTLDAHAMDPVSVIRMARSIGTIRGRILLVACEPETLGGEDGYMGLSDPVSAAVGEAARLVEKLIGEALEQKEND